MAPRPPSASVHLSGDRTLGIHPLHIVGSATDPPVGALDVALRIDVYVAGELQVTDFPAFQLELADVTAGEAPERVLDTIAPAYHPPDQRVALAFGGRHYLLRLAPAPAYLAHQGGWQRWSVQAAGVLLAGLIAALMLVLSGERAKVRRRSTKPTAARGSVRRGCRRPSTMPGMPLPRPTTAASS